MAGVEGKSTFVPCTGADGSLKEPVPAVMTTISAFGGPFFEVSCPLLQENYIEIKRTWLEKIYNGDPEKVARHLCKATNTPCIRLYPKAG